MGWLGGPDGVPEHPWDLLRHPHQSPTGAASHRVREQLACDVPLLNYCVAHVSDARWMHTDGPEHLAERHEQEIRYVLRKW
jgi:hypothetical protein